MCAPRGTQGAALRGALKLAGQVRVSPAYPLSKFQPTPPPQSRERDAIRGTPRGARRGALGPQVGGVRWAKYIDAEGHFLTNDFVFSWDW